MSAAHFSQIVLVEKSWFKIFTQDITACLFLCGLYFLIVIERKFSCRISFCTCLSETEIFFYAKHDRFLSRISLFVFKKDSSNFLFQVIIFYLCGS